MSSLKLAVFLLVVFVLLSIWGTIVESMYGASYAKWQVYLSPLFILTEVLLFINILFATLVRLPFKKARFGFYMIHLGLMSILVGAAITAFFGIDGSITLLPGKKTNAISINEPVLVVHYWPKNETKHPQMANVSLPKVVREYKKPSKTFFSFAEYNLSLDRYIPFAKSNTIWQPVKDPKQKTVSMMMEIKGHGFQRMFELSNLSYEETEKHLGPLFFQMAPQLNQECLKKYITDKKIKYLIETDNKCIPLSQLTTKGESFEGLIVKSLQQKPIVKASIVLKNSKEYVFYPSKAVYPVVGGELGLDLQAPIAFVELNRFRERPSVLFLKDDSLAIGKHEKWSFHDIQIHKAQPLPWMNINIVVNRIIKNKIRDTEWSFDLPRDDAKTHYAAKVTVRSKKDGKEVLTAWVDSTKVNTLMLSEQSYLHMKIAHRQHTLPYQLELDRFKMDTNPGTMQAASYESFVKVYDAQGIQNEHVYMNNPLKKGKFTFYQSSYFSLNNKKEYASVLSVNYDPGRWLKYLGSLFLVLGSILHYLKRKKVSKPMEK